MAGWGGDAVFAAGEAVHELGVGAVRVDGYVVAVGPAGGGGFAGF